MFGTARARSRAQGTGYDVDAALPILLDSGFPTADRLLPRLPRRADREGRESRLVRVAAPVRSYVHGVRGASARSASASGP